MKSRGRPIARLLVLAGILLTASAPAGSSSVVPAAAPGRDPAASLRPEVRLRKLHLVRPDLIPYPIAYEVYC